MKDNEENSEGSDVFNLILKLRKEKLFVRNEKLNIQKLNEQITNKTLDIIQSVWVTTKQRFLLCQREVASHNCQRIDSLHKSVFVEAKHELGFQASVKICTLLDIIRSNPKQVAKWLVVGEQILDETKQYACLLESIVSGLYACCVFPEDTKYMLVLLHELAKLEFDHCENPRRTIKQRTCSFKNLYFLFHEVLQPAKNFVNATFQMPILQVMAYTDYYLDMDPEKTVMRFNQIDNNPTNFKTLEDYRNEVTSKLAKFTNNFISSILENVYGFPKSIAWIIHNMSQIIEKSFGAKEANAIVTELLFTLYICPVILDPEQYGICNAQVTDITRHNLIQVGQILQSLALNKFENTDVRFMDLFELLDKSSFASFFEMLFYDVEGFTEPPIETSPSLNRGIFLFTGQELSNLVCFLQRVHTECGLNNFNSVSIEELLSALSGPLSRDNSPKSSRPSSHEISESVPKKSNFFHMGGKNHHTKSSPDDVKTSNDVVLVFPVDSYHCEPVGLLSEDKVLKMSTMAVKNDEIFSTAPAKLNENVIQNGHIKQAYPSYADEGSIGNTSDNLEAISEAASNHSVASSLELENEDQNDNLSDMVSANVSGRGTPNISGRDTPSSQVNENEDRGAIEARQADIAQPQPQISRQIRSEIDDKFCKFEIKKLIEGDETISIISETWSTDVLASDNETVDASEGRHERTGLQLVDQAIHEVPIGNILDISETQSESAWSTDVMTSDTERLTEVDNDDAGSVAQLDDTNSVARSDDIRSETDENAPASLRRLSSISNSYGSNLPSSSTNYTGGSNSSGSFEEYRKVELKNGKIYHSEQLTTAQTDNNANNVVFKSLTMSADTQQITHNSVSYSEHTTSDIKTSNSVFSKSSSSVTTLINNRVQTVKEGDLIDIAGPSGLGLNKRESDAASYLKQSRVPKKFEDRPNEILLSNCSLNSSSSGSSSNSFENKNSHNENSEQWENKQWLNSSGSSLNVTLTPSESTSELSVLSVSNMNNPGNMLHKKSVTLRNLKPSTSTGAIPKSISFDMTADKGLDDEHRNKRGSFFGKLKMGFKNRRTKASFRNHEDFSMEGEDYGVAKKVYGESPVKINNNNNIELPEDILAKYRTKPFAESSPIKENCDVTKSPKERNIGDSNTSSNNEVNSFNDIKKKLRLVLSNTSEIPHCVKTVRLCVKNKIETVLRLELGKARKLNEWSSSARISEAIRCVNLLNDTSCLKLLQSMKEDLLLRSTYVQYLICSRQELLFCDMYLNSLQQQISDEKEQCEKYLATVCVREFLAENEDLILRFCEEFKQLSLADEKCDFLQNFYSKLFAIMNGTSPWQDVFLSRETEIEVTLERMIMSKIYKNSIYPNGDGDRDRDFILHEHIAKLSKIITPYHKDLMIHKMYLRECPWLPAQDALKGLNACRTPRDKVNCVVHCAKCIMDLLALSQSHGSTTADDFTPVLVYVIIKVNPEALLSTIQFVNSFLNNQLFGEDQYWWTQFCASVEYIKNMDYSD